MAKQTAMQKHLEWLKGRMVVSPQMEKQLLEEEKQKAHQYAEFAIRCDREKMKILNFEDWIKL